MFDFIRVAEKESGMELDWYIEYFVNSTKFPDFSLVDVREEDGKSVIELFRLGKMIMPVDVEVTMNDGAKHLYHIPLGIMRGAKKELYKGEFHVAEDWYWTNTSYTLEIGQTIGDIESVVIDPSMRLADMNRADNMLNFKEIAPTKKTVTKSINKARDQQIKQTR